MNIQPNLATTCTSRRTRFS